MSISDFSDRKERAPYVRFEKGVVDDPQASVAAGHYVGRDVDYALVTPPYTRDVFKQEAKDFFQNMKSDAAAGRIDPEWLKKWESDYAAWQKGEEIPLVGTPIKGWLMASPAQQQACIQANILTVEDLAQANDEGVVRLGLGGQQLRTLARSALAATNDIGKVVMESAAKDQKIAVLEGSVASLSNQVEELVKQMRQYSMVNPQVPPQTVYVSRETINAIDILDEPQEDEHMTAPGETESDWVKLYTEKFGQPPHHRAKLASIKAKVQAAS